MNAGAAEMESEVCPRRGGWGCDQDGRRLPRGGVVLVELRQKSGRRR